MRIVVGVKWVPRVGDLRFDPTTKRLVREGVRGEVSAFDVRALVAAIDLRARHGGEVVALTMGPPAAREGLVECLALGADRAVHVSDAALAGSDTLATARALAAAVRTLAPDLVLLGRSSVDAETGQVGPEMAECLDWPQVTVVRAMTVDVATRSFEAERETDDGFETVASALPAVVTVAEDVAEERFPSKAAREAAKEKPIEALGLAAIGLTAADVGTTGSPTWVAELEEAPVARRGEVLDATDPAAWPGLLRARLEASGALAAGADERPVLPSGARPDGQPLWVVAEAGPRGWRPVTFELLAKAAGLTTRLGGIVEAVVIGGDARADLAALAAAGADRVLVARGAQLDPPTTDAHAAVLAEAMRARGPRLVLLGATAYGRDLAPRVAGRLGLGLTGDAIDLDVDGEGRVRQLKPAFGGTIIAPILSNTRPEMATVRAGMLRAARPDASRPVVVETLAVPAVPPRVRVVRFSPIATEAAERLDAAPLVIGVGKGVGGPEGLAPILAMAERLGAGVAATREVTDLGWLPRQHQVGLTGRAIAPRLYVGLGLSGQMEHVVGLRRAGTIVAINKSPKAPVFKQADIGIVAEIAQVLPWLEAVLRA